MSLHAPSLLRPSAALAALLVLLAPGAVAWKAPDGPIDLGEATLAYLDQGVVDGWLDQDLVDDIKTLALAPDPDLHDSVYARYMAALAAAPPTALPDLGPCEDTCEANFQACKAVCDSQYASCKRSGGSESLCSMMRQRCIDACEEEYRACIAACEAIPTLPATVRPDTEARASPSSPTLEEDAACEDNCEKAFKLCQARCDQQYQACKEAGGSEEVCSALRQRCIDACEDQYRACRRLCDATSGRELAVVRDLPAAA